MDPRSISQSIAKELIATFITQRYAYWDLQSLMRSMIVHPRLRRSLELPPGAVLILNDLSHRNHRLLILISLVRLMPGVTLYYNQSLFRCS